MDLKHLVILIFQVSLAGIVFSYGLRADFADLLHLLRRPGLLARSLIAVLVVMPAVAIALARWFDFTPTVEIALVALAISPLPLLLPTREVKAGGSAYFGLGLMVALAVLSMALVPLAVQLLGSIFRRPYVIAPLAVAVVMLTSILLPLLAGMVTRALSPRLADTTAKQVERAGKILMPVAVVVLLIAAAPGMWHLLGNGTLIAITAFVAIGFAVGHIMGRPDPANSAVLAFSTACRHPGTVLAIAATNYPDEHFRAALLIYLLVNAILGLLYALWHRRRAAPAQTR